MMSAMTTGADPVRDAWEAAGRPSPEAPLKAAGQCARCGTAGDAARWQDVLSANFGDWDRLRWRQSGVLCAACAWAFGHKPFRLRAHVITPGSCEEAGPARLRESLSAPLPRTVLVLAPIGQQKHLLPYAPYGAVVTDHGHLEWTAADAERLAVLAGLRALGFGEAALAEAVPRWAILGKLPPGDRLDVMTLWPALAPWRERPACLDVACRATRAPKEDGNGTD